MTGMQNAEPPLIGLGLSEVIVCWIWFGSRGLGTLTALPRPVTYRLPLIDISYSKREGFTDSIPVADDGHDIKPQRRLEN